MVSTTLNLAGSSESPQNEGQAIAAAIAHPNPWIVNSWFDTLFVFGGMLWILFGLHYLIYGWNSINPDMPSSGAYAVNTLFIVFGTLGQHIFSDTHTVATYIRIYATKESRQTFRLYAYYLPWLSLTLLTLSLFFKEAGAMVVYIHLMWVFQHYVGQCYGIGLVYCYKRGYYMTTFERETFRWFMHSISYFVITRILTHRDYSPYVYWGSEVPFWGLPLWIYEIGKIALITMSVMFVGVILRKYVREGKLIPVPTLALVVTVAGIGLSVGMASAMVWIYGPPFFHGSQYLALSLGFYLKDKGFSEGKITKKMFKAWFSTTALHYWAYVIVGGMFIYVFIPHFFENFGLTFAYVATVIQACINFHHFVSDAAIWRLRDKRCRDVLIA